MAHKCPALGDESVLPKDTKTTATEGHLPALAGVAQLLGHHVLREIASWIPNWAQVAGWIPGKGRAGGSQLMLHSHADVFLSSLKINDSLQKEKKKDNLPKETVWPQRIKIPPK